MDSTRFDRLTKRHRDCLRGVRQLKGSKEIADELGIEKSTVDGYLTEAVKVLGARNRRDAALQLETHDREQDARAASTAAISRAPDDAPDVGSPPPAIAASPDKMGGDSARLAGDGDRRAITASPDEVVVGQPGGTAEPPTRARSAGLRLPYRRKGEAGNDLSVGERLLWVPVITFGLAIGFGMLMMGLQVLTGLVQGFSHTLS